MTSGTRIRTDAGPRRRSRTRSDAQALDTRAKKRFDLQGLRALAVGMVMLNHAFDWPHGGFVGVDIFFVLSGFLMTTVLFKEYERSGKIGLLAFYRRRIRRLIPASAAVIVVTVAVSYLLFLPSRAMSTVWDGVASLFFFSNWRFAAQATDYFTQDTATSPLQHYWSLSLEEQYYLIWPLTILAIGFVVARTRRGRVNAALITLGITAALYGVSHYLTATNVAAAYFITPARLWELSVGASVALCMPLFDRVGRRLRPAIALVSVAGMILAAAITPSGAGFPAPWAALAVLSTATFIAFPWRPQRSWLNPLDNPALSYVGDISYSLYLWHFPAIILIGEAFRGIADDGSPIPAAIALVASFVLASLSYRFIEEPVRQSRWLEPRKRKRATRSYKPIVLAGTGVAAVLAVVFAVLVDSGGRYTGASADAPTTSPATAGPSVQNTDDEAVLKGFKDSIRTAIAATEWPAELSPSIDTVLAGYEHDERVHACGVSPYPGVDACSWGSPDAPVSVVMVGDSTSIAYTPMMRSLAENSNGQLRVTTFAFYSCLFADVIRQSPDPNAKKACAERNELAIAEMAKLKPTYLFITNVPSALKVEDGSDLTMAAYEAGLNRFLERVGPNAGKTVFLSATPNEKNLMKCYSPRISPKECAGGVQPSWRAVSGAEKKVAAAVGGVWVDTRAVYCSGDVCPPFADGFIIRFDATHITDEYSVHIAPGIVALLNQSGIRLSKADGEEATS